MSLVNSLDFKDELRISVTPRLSRLPGLFESVENFGADNGIPDANIYVVNLILDELIANYVQHSIGRVKKPKIDVCVRIDDDGLLLIFEDSGPLFDPTAVSDKPDPPRIGEREVGGVGLYLVKSYADRIHYRAVDGRNHIAFRCTIDTPLEGPVQ